MKRISVDEAKARFSAMVDGVLHRGERYVIEQDGQEVAALVSVPELGWIEAASTRDVRPGGALALVGLWGDGSAGPTVTRSGRRRAR